MQSYPVNIVLPMTLEHSLLILKFSDTVHLPSHLKDGHYSGASKLNHSNNYLYPHSYPNHYVKQEYLPSDISYRVYYMYGKNKVEEAAKKYWDLIKH